MRGGTVSVDSAHYVSANAAGDDLTVTGNVLGENGKTSVSASNGAKIDVGGFVTESSTPNGTAHAISANGAEVTVGGNVAEGGENGDAGHAINVNGNGARVEVAGDVIEKGPGYAIGISVSGTVIVKKDVTESGNDGAIYATGSGTTVTVKGNVVENDDGSAIYAADGAKVTVEGNVTENDDDNAIYATGSGTTVTVKGNVVENDGGYAINATYGSKVVVGGNVTETGNGKGLVVAVTEENTTVVIEGKVDVAGGVALNTGAALYLGELKKANQILDADKIHYLIGIAPEGSAALSAVTLVSDIVAGGTIDGVNEKGYKYTTTADKDTLNGKTIILKPADGKKLTVSGYDGADVKCVKNADGTVTFTIGKNFKGGMQNLVLVLTDKPGQNQGSGSGSGLAPAAVYFIIPVASAANVEFTAPEGVEKGLIKKLDSADHAGLTVYSSLVGDSSIKVLKDGKKLNADDFCIYNHADGFVDIVMSNAYLYDLGSGSHGFTAVVGGLEIPFTVVVAR